MGNFSNPIEMSRSELLTWTRKVLKDYKLRPRKRLSQSFVVDPLLIREVVSHVGSRRVLEVGCGIGTLTRAISVKVESLLCVEVDWRLCEVVSNLIDNPLFVVVNGDARYTPIICSEVVSNVPYHITSDILLKISRENSVKKAVLTLQREVADRLLARPGCKNYGKITVLVNVLFNVSAGGVYPPNSFFPKPEVYHRVVILSRKRNYTREIETLENVVKISFSQRRRLILKVFTDLIKVNPADLGPLRARLEGRRVFNVDPETWLEIALLLQERGIRV